MSTSSLAECPAAGSWSPGGTNPNNTGGLCSHTKPPNTGAALLRHAHSVQHRWTKYTVWVLLYHFTSISKDRSSHIWQYWKSFLGNKTEKVFFVFSQSTSWPVQTSLLYMLWRHLAACCQPVCPHGNSSRLFPSNHSNSNNNSRRSSSSNNNSTLHHSATWCKSFIFSLALHLSSNLVSKRFLHR